MPKDTLQICLNNEIIIEYDRDIELPDYQQSYLMEMDADMDNGIPFGEDILKSPSILDRTHYVTNTLVNALLQDNLDEANAMCAYLATRVTHLEQVSCETSDTDKGISVNLKYKQEQAVE